ncbi:class II glutamine amidotransferase [Bifidobacterium sp. ESL0775]|uniref:class II glutamine amidotransferase n=1 Tax=Bifidobacterium sp. ESL0775 TaxID=2983230 RepID=UPI0023F978B7|nr:class II glutamine amidotransferase [Bifidobacterium sp. ESL0775]WEV68575.1 class II glutamine amidotransferase [Bifidobacterium sp. ESL0775]
MSLKDILGEANTEDFRRLSEIHKDGWGLSLKGLAGDGASQLSDDRTYHTTVAAYDDPMFSPLADMPAQSALWHFRWGSPGIAGVMENQQPFAFDGIEFIHNGHIVDTDNVSILDNPGFEVDRDVVRSISVHSDSAIFFAVIVGYARQGMGLSDAVSHAVAKMRETYPASSYNCIVRDAEEMVVVEAGRGGKTSRVITEFYNDYGWTGQGDDYRAMRFRDIRDGRNHGLGVLVASSGFRQDAADGWREMGNNTMLVASRSTGKYFLRSL